MADPIVIPSHYHRVRREVEQREQTILSNLISRYRGGQLTDREAALGIAEISGLRALVTTLERNLTKESTHA